MICIFRSPTCPPPAEARGGIPGIPGSQQPWALQAVPLGDPSLRKYVNKKIRNFGFNFNRISADIRIFLICPNLKYIKHGFRLKKSIVINTVLS